MDREAIFLIKKYLSDNAIIDFENDTNAVVQRLNGKSFSFEEHVRALIYSLLTNQRRWSDVEPKLPMIDELFFHYDVHKIKQHDGAFYENGITNLRCGNKSIKYQMANLHYNINILEKITSRYGSLDTFVTQMDPEVIVGVLSQPGTYKLKGVGSALAWEYLRNVGIDGAKPDLHLKRFFGSERMGESSQESASDYQVEVIVDDIAKQTGLSKFEIDYIIWAFCATGKGEICSANPKCEKCVISKYCNRGRKNQKVGFETQLSPCNDGNVLIETEIACEKQKVILNPNQQIKEDSCMYEDRLKQMKKDIRPGLVGYMAEKDPGKSESTYKMYASDSNYLINNGQANAFVQFMRSDSDMPEIKGLIREILIEHRGIEKVTDGGAYYYEKLCWQREYIKLLGGIDSLLGI